MHEHDENKMRWVSYILLVAFLMTLAVTTGAKKTRHEHIETWWTQQLASKYHAEAEVKLKDGSRADLVSECYAIEIDWAPKWPESIGQAELYSILTEKKPGVILLITDPAAEKKYVDRCKLVCERLKIKLWLEDASQKQPTRKQRGAR